MYENNNSYKEMFYIFLNDFSLRAIFYNLCLNINIVDIYDVLIHTGKKNTKQKY
jgi:hypothetical protein